MPIRIIKVQLSLEERKRLEAVINSNKSTLIDKQKAEVLLLTDVGEYGAKISPSNTANKVGLSKHSIGRIREVYAKNSSIDDVFRFSKLSDQKRCHGNYNKDRESLPKKRTIRSIKMGDENNEPILIENAKCRVTLSKEERTQLEAFLKNGKQSARKFNRAKILLLADEGIDGPALTDKEIANKLDLSMPTVARVRRLLITEGQIDSVLKYKHQKAGRMPKINGEVQAILMAQACGAPPDGRCKWTVRLLADKLVELAVIDSISHTAVGNALKKMNLNLGSAGNG